MEQSFKVINNGNKFIRVKNIRERTYDIPDEFGNLRSVKGYQYTVIGNNREWTDWIDKEKFKIANPDFTFE